MDQEPYVPYVEPPDDELSNGYEPFEPFKSSKETREERPSGKRRRPCERGIGLDWMLEMEAERAARAARMRDRVLQAGRGVKRREMMSEPSRPPNARTRRAGE